MSIPDNASWLADNAGDTSSREYNKAHEDVRKALEILRKSLRSEASRKQLAVLEESIAMIDDALCFACEVADNCEETLADAKRACDLAAEALNDAKEDRRKLLAKLGLSDSAWAAQGGTCEVYIDAAIDAVEQVS